jgi:TatD DNase family protein
MFAHKDLFINIHTHSKTKHANELIIRNAYTPLSASQIAKLPYLVAVGLHPWYLHKMSINSCVQKLYEISVPKNVVAVGEIGIDRAITTTTSLEVQRSYFEAQLNVAAEINKPVIIHAVHSYSDFIPYLKKSKVPFIFHQFNGNEQQARELLRYPCKLSFGVNLLSPKSQAILKAIPPNSFFLETDVQTNYTIHDIYAKAAKIRQMNIDVLKEQLFHTFAQIFSS